MMTTRLLFAVAVLLIFQVVLYFGCECLQKRLHNVYLPIDDGIPFIEGTALLYMLWFPLIALLPMALYRCTPASFGQYYTAMALDIVLSVACYLIYPTTFERPTPSSSWTGRLMQGIYASSFRGINCAPSLHCSSCYLVILCTLTCPNMPQAACALVVTLAAAIVVSTLTTKQHVLIDVLTAIPLALACWLVGLKLPFTGLVQWIAAV